jgi:hypothetical protein
LGAFALGVFEGINPGRLLRWEVLPADQAQGSFWVHPPPTGLGVGFFVFLAGAGIAIVGASTMLTNLRRKDGQRASRPRLPRDSVAKAHLY